jgi:hypothetical protein
MLKKKIWPNFPRVIEDFTQKIVTKPSKIWVWNPGSEIRDPEKTYSGSQIPIQGSKRYQIPDSGSATQVVFNNRCKAGALLTLEKPRD